MPFQLVSKFQPTGDQPQAIDTLVKSLKAGHQHQTLLGVTGSGKTFTIANVIQELQRPTLVISHNKTLAAQLYQEFRDFFPHNAVSYFVSYYDYYQPESYIPSTDTYIEKESDINDEIDKLRLSTTANLLTRPDCIVVASVSCIYNLGSPVEYGRHYLELIEGELIDRQVLLARLIDIQYLRSDFDLKRGTFRVKGDTIQIWPANLDYALKLDLLDNEVKTITPIDPLTGEVHPTTDTPHTSRYTIYPTKHYQTGQADQSLVLQTIKRDLAFRLQELKDRGKIIEAYRLGERVKHDLEMLAELGYVNGIENYSRYFDGRRPGDPPYSLLDYMSYNAKNFHSEKSSFLTVIDESHITVPQLHGMYAGDLSRKQTLIDFGFRLPSALDNRPLKFDEILPRLPQIIYASATPNAWELDLSANRVAEQLIRPTGLVDPEIDVRPIKGQVIDLVKEILLRKTKGQRVLVTTLTKRTAEALTEYLNDADKIQEVMNSVPGTLHPVPALPKVQYLHADVKTLDRSDILDSLRSGEFDVLVGINLLREGLDLPEVSLVAILDADKEGFLRSKSALIQTMGRAARHQDGKVILYADTVTGSMRGAIDEVARRRRVQLAYNAAHYLTPQSIHKPIRDKLLDRVIETPQSRAIPKALKDQGWSTIADIKSDNLTPKDTRALIKTLKQLMHTAAKDWDFEAAAQYRDTIKKLE